MKTNELINDLSQRLAPAEDVRRWALAVWIGGTGAVLALALAVLPFRADLNSRLSSPPYAVETVLCFLAFALSTAAAYRSSIPGLFSRRDARWAWAPPLLLLALALSRFAPQTFSHEFFGEMNFYRGRCGSIIMIIGFVDAGILAFLARRAAPTRLDVTAAWIAVSAGSLGLFVTQFFVCGFENFLHLLIWHFIPVFALIAIGIPAGRRLLRW